MANGEFINDYLNPSFNYKYANFAFAMTMYNVNVQKDECEDINYFTNDEVVELNVSYTLNSFFLKGYVIIDDKTGKVDRYIGRQFTYATIMFGVTDSSTGKMDENQKFNIVVMVNKMNIVERNQNVLRYRVDFFDINFWKASGSISYSNFKTGGDKEPDETIKEKDKKTSEILKSIFKLADLNLKADTLDNIFKSKMDYMTMESDNVQTAFNYIMSRTILDRKDYGDREQNLLLLTYNIKKDQYEFINIGKYEQDKYFDEEEVDGKSERGAVISMEPDDKCENFVIQDRTEMAIKCHKTRNQLLQSMFNKVIYYYDYTYGEMRPYQINSSEIVNILQKTNYNGGDKLIEKTDFLNAQGDKKVVITVPSQIGSNSTEKLKIKPTNTYQQSSYDLNIYRDIVEMILNSASLAINITGNVNRNAGMPFQTTVLDDISENGDKKYIDFSGNWIIQTVEHVVRPQKGEYRNNLILMRNWKEKR